MSGNGGGGKMTNETIPVIRELAQFLAELIARHVLLYDRVHYVDGKRYRVTVVEHTTKDDTQPMKAAQ
jgi:hypothetical protein